PVDLVGRGDEYIGESARRIAREADVGIRATALLVDSRQVYGWGPEYGVRGAVIDAAIIVLNRARIRGDRVRAVPRVGNNFTCFAFKASVVAADDEVGLPFLGAHSADRQRKVRDCGVGCDAHSDTRLTSCSVAKRVARSNIFRPKEL